MPAPHPEDERGEEIVLENGRVRVEISRATGLIADWTELATGFPLLDSGIGPQLRGNDREPLAPDSGGFLATVEENEALLYDPFGHGGIAVQTLYRLLPDENAMEAEIALSNRTLDPIPLRSVGWSGLAASFDPPAFFRTTEPSGIGGFSLSDVTLAGRTTATFHVRFSAFGDLKDNGRLGVQIGAEAAFGLAESATIRVARPVRGARLFLHTEDGQTLEAPIDADPDQALVLPLGGVRPIGAILRSADGVDLAPRSVASALRVMATRLPEIDWAAQGDEQLALLHFDAPSRHLVAIERARRATLAGDDAAAEAQLETALLTNGDDPLTWWAKAGAQRRSDPDRDRVEWLNARYLRPLEPLVAAEALLAQESSDDAENPLLRMVAGREGIAAGCVAAYAEAGSFRDAITLGTRILAVQDWRRVRLLMAGLYLTQTRMSMEAAEHHASSRRAESEGPGEPGALERELNAALNARFGMV